MNILFMFKIFYPDIAITFSCLICGNLQLIVVTDSDTHILKIIL